MTIRHGTTVVRKVARSSRGSPRNCRRVVEKVLRLKRGDLPVSQRRLSSVVMTHYEAGPD